MYFFWEVINTIHEHDGSIWLVVDETMLQLAAIPEAYLGFFQTMAKLFLCFLKFMGLFLPPPPPPSTRVYTPTPHSMAFYLSVTFYVDYIYFSVVCIYVYGIKYIKSYLHYFILWLWLTMAWSKVPRDYGAHNSTTLCCYMPI